MFLPLPNSEARSALYARDKADERYVANLTRLWACWPDVYGALVNLRTLVTDKSALSMRNVGIADQEIFNVTVFVALRLAFSTVNDALGARSDQALAESAPSAARNAVGHDRSVAGAAAE